MDVERLQEALKDFEKRGKKEVCPILDQFLCHVAKTGETMVQWSQFKGYFIFKLEKVMDDFRTSAPEPRGPPNPNVEYIPFEEMKERILKIVTGFNGSNVNGPGTPRPVSRTKVSLSTPMTTNGLPDSTEHKEPSLQQTEEKKHSESPASDSEGAQSSPVKNKHSEDDPAEAEGHEVKRLKFDKEGEARDAPNQTASSEVSSGMGEETEASSTSQDKEKDATRQHCTEKEEEDSFMSPRNIGQDRKDQEKDSDSSSVAEESCEENNQMEESEQPRAEKDSHSADSDISASATSGADCSDTEELGSYASETPENSSESPMENSEEATEAADEPMEQD
ncbi:serine/threonine-protein phosphatase 4 regulatory subunit 2 isoform 4-T4 [Sylvia borin]